MSTVLTDDQIEECYSDKRYLFARSIEQAVLQSPEVQAWKRDAERFTAALSVLRNLEQACDDLAAARTRDGYLLEVASGRESYLIELDDARRAARAVIYAAMEKKP